MVILGRLCGSRIAHSAEMCAQKKKIAQCRFFLEGTLVIRHAYQRSDILDLWGGNAITKKDNVCVACSATYGQGAAICGVTCGL